MRRERKNTVKKNSLSPFKKKLLILLLGAPLFGLLFVFTRMKSVEMDYESTRLTKKLDEVISQNKELRAKRADLLSIGNLKKMAQKFGLREPQPNQIIVITDEK